MADGNNPNVEKIRTLNDLLRTTLQGGSIYMTSGVQALGPAAVMEILERVRTYPAVKFDSETDPHRERDFGIVSYQGERIYWKIDYFDKEQKQHSEDPSDASLTHRVMTIMLSEEY